MAQRARRGKLPLATFVSQAVLTRDEIMDKIRGIDWEAYNRSIDVAVSRLRQKLQDDPKRPRYIKTVWGSGYLFLPMPVSVRKGSPDA